MKRKKKSWKQNELTVSSVIRVNFVLLDLGYDEEISFLGW